MTHEDKELQSIVLKNPWRNTYWFARMLINGDKYGAIGKESELLANICLGLRRVMEDEAQADENKVKLCRTIIRQILDKRFSRYSVKTDRINLFYNDLIQKIISVDDIAVLILTAESIMIPINEAMKYIPSNDREYTEATAKAYLDELKESALATVINMWDDVGVEGCLNAERIAVVRQFTILRRDIMPMPEYETNMILTTFVQEFERRLGQKRKSRAGGSLEDVTSFLFNYFNIKAEQRPEHFQTDIEVDKWIKCKDKWLIGISCKRTLRERWKQVSSAGTDILSNDKLTLLGGLRHVFYLRDDSRKLANALKHVGMNSYVRPISKFIEDIRKEQV
jgi:hypothetical protein